MTNLKCEIKPNKFSYCLIFFDQSIFKGLDIPMKNERNCLLLYFFFVIFESKTKFNSWVL